MGMLQGLQMPFWYARRAFGESQDDLNMQMMCWDGDKKELCLCNEGIECPIRKCKACREVSSGPSLMSKASFDVQMSGCRIKLPPGISEGDLPDISGHISPREGQPFYYTPYPTEEVEEVAFFFALKE
ncbi:hypothetical protein TNIN_445151 [Trichonephila inaurata madagascariensis]|uniref:Uncharacterized protein n=1 Tax=Trichonephila inaurata madagascariensis TaxID=2747483 RepID=A0A8X7CDM7_9ARAC|nr:hypothetical protein TNIN_445151 [Trichonephila inaurata madagascariensis]